MARSTAPWGQTIENGAAAVFISNANSGTAVAAAITDTTPATAWAGSAGAYYIRIDGTSGALSATGSIQGCATDSSDTDDWVDQATFSLSVAAPDAAGSAVIAIVYGDAGMQFGRVVLTAISGTGATVAVTR